MSSREIISIPIKNDETFSKPHQHRPTEIHTNKFKNLVLSMSGFFSLTKKNKYKHEEKYYSITPEKHKKEYQIEISRDGKFVVTFDTGILYYLNFNFFLL